MFSVADYHKKLKSGETTVLKTIEAHFSVIEKYDKNLNTFISTNKEQALQKAKEIDKRLAEGLDFRLLEGVSFSVKDMFCTKGVATTAGSRMLKEFIPPYDATVVKNLESAGAIVLGKANQDEFAMGSTNETSFFGASVNPWNEERVPGGSSGGSAAAVAARMAMCSLGTDTGGSVRQPAHFCGTVGFKPTYGRVSRYGAVSYTHLTLPTTPYV